MITKKTAYKLWDSGYLNDNAPEKIKWQFVEELNRTVILPYPTLAELIDSCGEDSKAMEEKYVKLWLKLNK